MPEDKYSSTNASRFSSVIAPTCRILIHFFDFKSVNLFSTRHTLNYESIFKFFYSILIALNGNKFVLLQRTTRHNIKLSI